VVKMVNIVNTVKTTELTITVMFERKDAGMLGEGEGRLGGAYLIRAHVEENLTSRTRGHDFGTVNGSVGLPIPFPSIPLKDFCDSRKD